MGRIGDDAAFPDSGVWNITDVYRHLRFDPVPAVVRSASLWLDAADLTTITESGGDVSQWDNKGTLGNFTQGTGASQPTTGVSTLNGLNVIDFATDFLTAVNTNEWKFLHDGTKTLYGIVVKSGAGLYGIVRNTAGTANSIGAGFRSGSSGTLFNHTVTNNSVVSSNSNSGLTANQFYVATVLADPSNGTAANRSELFVDDGAATKNNTETNAPSTANPTFALQIGASGNNEQVFTGSIAEIVIVSGAQATEGNRVIIRDYLNAKWGVF